MADTKISALTAATSVAATDQTVIVQGGASKMATAAMVRGGLFNQSTTDQSVPAATLTYITNSNIAVPVGKLAIGTRFEWMLVGTKTAAGTTTGRAIHVRIGTLGTTGDAAILTFTSGGTPTATVDTGFWTIICTIRGPLSASCIASGGLNLNRGIGAAAAGGLLASGVNTENLQVTSGTFDATVASLIVGLTMTTATAEAITFQVVQVTATNL